MKKILITGAKGLLGRNIKSLQQVDIQLIGLDKEDLDIRSEDQVRNAICEINPDILINAAALTNVDFCEENNEQAQLVNHKACLYLAKACNENNTKLIHISTDYVFDGETQKMYEESDVANPVNFYGHSKLSGEIEIMNHCDDYIIARTALLFGQGGKNFISQMPSLLLNNQSFSAVSDSFSSATYAPDLATRLIDLAKDDRKGIYHLCNPGIHSFYEVALLIEDQLKTGTKIKKTKFSDLKLAAKRPSYTPLMSRYPEAKMRPLKKALLEFIESISKERGIN